MTPSPASSVQSEQPGVLQARGAWVLPQAEALSAQLRQWKSPIERIDGQHISQLDSSGALLLIQALKQHQLAADAIDLRSEHRDLFHAVLDVIQSSEAPTESTSPSSLFQMLDQTGRAMVRVVDNALDLMGFLGIALHRMVGTLFHPSRMRWTSLVHHMQETGFNAVPLLSLLSIMIGAVLAFLGATVLREFGAEIMVIDLVVFSFLREFGVLLTAILLAGRTASAFCAQIGMMKSQQEIDAIRTIGLDEIDPLVVPRLIALLIMLPALSVVATLAGLVGGMIVSALSLGIGVDLYIERVHQSIELQHYLVGLIKVPIFALVIALIGCSEGFRVEGTSQSVGERTTSAVVRSITMVIVIDALAAIYFMEIGW
ncbi:MAG: ABC transporter permease [Pseudomonadota bacterium]